VFPLRCKYEAGTRGAKPTFAGVSTKGNTVSFKRVNVALEQAMKAQRGSILSLTSAVDGD
jgi:hypothetical protein